MRGREEEKRKNVEAGSGVREDGIDIQRVEKLSRGVYRWGVRNRG